MTNITAHDTDTALPVEKQAEVTCATQKRTTPKNSSGHHHVRDLSGILEELWKKVHANKLGYRETLEHVERMLVQKYCGLFKKNLSGVARKMKVSRPTLYNLMEKFKIENPRKKAGK